MYHYTYRITNKKLNKHYYGTRSSKRKPKEDIGIHYFSSSRDKWFIQDQQDNPQDYRYKVVYIFSTRKEALELEIKLHNKFNVGINESFFNKSKQTSTGFDTAGIKLSNNIKNIMSSETKNFWKNTNDDFRKKHSEKTALGVSKSWKNMSEEDYKKRCDNISKALKGKPQPEWKKKQHSEKMTGAGNSKAKHIGIYNSENELIFECNGNFKIVCEKNNLPHNSLRKSHNANGEKILQTKRGKSNAEKRGWTEYIGWYAKEIS